MGGQCSSLSQCCRNSSHKTAVLEAPDLDNGESSEITDVPNFREYTLEQLKAGKLGVARYKCRSTSSYSCDPMLEASLKEKDARIEALETQMAEEKAENKRRTDEMAKEIAKNKKSSEAMMRFLEDMRTRFPNSSS
ncbi:unnamed protein product [Arabidopsis halleri]